MIEAFEPRVPQDEIDELRRRLQDTRFPGALPGSGWDYGADDSFLRGLRDHWLQRFDWRRVEAGMKAQRHFRWSGPGGRIHFLHARGEGPRPLPLILTHGWPGSFLEFDKLIPLLTQPGRFGGSADDAFDCVVPSLPGFGFSDPPAAPGMDAFRNADLWHDLMQALGYPRYGAQGGDLGAGVSTALGLRHPDALIGLHLNYVPGSFQPQGEPSACEHEWSARMLSWNERHGGYAHVQGHEPQTLAAALSDSPMGLAAWMVQRFRDWSDCDGDVLRRFTADELLANVSLYWFTQSIASSCRRYLDGRLAPLRLRPGERVAVPCGFALFPREIPFPPRERVERGYNVARWTGMPRGGHFAAAEEPALLAEDLRDFFRPLRSRLP
jgi:pimeloyl-ACP methyl ester carboxylesterase